ncbi:hypothetical protein GQX74_008988 [Glossina fuscipes]|nr:hypothetical protein GQX74_008988 [Glossina fuscipes]
MLKITTIIAFLLLIPYLVLGGFLVYYLYGVESCYSVWYYNIDLDDMGVDERTLAIIDSHYKNTTIIPDRKLDTMQRNSIYDDETTEAPTDDYADAADVLSDWLDIKTLHPPSNVRKNRPWKAHERPFDIEGKEEDEEGLTANPDISPELNPTDDPGKRRRKVKNSGKSNKRHRSERTNKNDRTEDNSEDLRIEKKKTRKSHKTGKIRKIDKIDNTDNIDAIIPNETDEPLPTPLRFALNNYCLSPYHGMLCMLGTILMGLSIVTFRVLHNVKTHLVKIVHTTVTSIAIFTLIGGMLELRFETVKVAVNSSFHIVSSWLVLACLLLEFLIAILFFWIIFKGSNNRLFLAPFHDIFGIWIFICLVGCCLSGKRVVIGDYKPENIFKFYCFIYAAFVIVLIILLSPWFEWDLAIGGHY